MKRVRVTCYEPIAAHPTYRQPWADVWVTFTAKPGRRRYEFAPTLLSRPELDVDLSDAREEANSPDASPGEVERLEDIAMVLETQRVFVDPDHPNPYYPSIYTATAWVDRHEAELMLAAFLHRLGFPRLKFAWSKRDGPLITPATLAPEA